MKKTVLGERTGEKYYIDLRQGWRMGDFAGLCMLLARWRQSHPNAHVTVTYGNHHWRSVYGNELDLAWIFRGLIDVLLEMENERDLIHNAVAMVGAPILGRVFSAHIWNDWARLRDDVVSDRVKLTGRRPDDDVMAKARALLDKKGVPAEFVTVHPLFDAGYNKYRNGQTGWWSNLITELSKHTAVVAIGTAGYGKHISIPKTAFQLFDLGLPAMLSLAAIANAKLHIGGETGLTLWASVCDVPVLAAYGRWGVFKDKARKLADFRPIPFTKPVIHTPLNGDVAAIAQVVAGMLDKPMRLPPVPPEPSLPLPSVTAVATKAKAAKRKVRAPRPKQLPVTNAVKKPAKTLKQLLAERRAKRSRA